MNTPKNNSIEYTCTSKGRDDKGNINVYRLRRISDDTYVNVTPNQLKEAIRSGAVVVLNLTLTSDNRLISKKEETSLKLSNAESFKKFILSELESLAKVCGSNKKPEVEVEELISNVHCELGCCVPNMMHYRNKDYSFHINIGMDRSEYYSAYFMVESIDDDEPVIEKAISLANPLYSNRNISKIRKAMEIVKLNIGKIGLLNNWYGI